MKNIKIMVAITTSKMLKLTKDLITNKKINILLTEKAIMRAGNLGITNSFLDISITPKYTMTYMYKNGIKSSGIGSCSGFVAKSSNIPTPRASK